MESSATHKRVIQVRQPPRDWYMAMLPRRAYLALAGGTLAGLAGCVDGEGEFLVSETQIIHQSGDPRYDYPDDVLVRVSLENRTSSRQEGILEVTLVYDPGTGDDDPGTGDDDVETWTETDDVEVSHAASLHPGYVFEDVYEAGRDLADYSVETELDWEG